eukprot:g3915.t1
MKMNLKSQGIQEHACGAIWHIAEKNDENKEHITTLGGIEAILRAMVSHGESVGVQVNACRAIRHLQIQIAKNGTTSAKLTIVFILRAMKKHKTSVDIQKCACAVLVHLVKADARHRTQIAEEGGLAAVLDAMKTHETEEDVQEQACGAIRTLACNGVEPRESRASVATILHAMKVHETSAGVQANACAALYRLVELNDENRSRIARLGGIVAILRAMKTHETGARVQAHACAALSAFWSLCKIRDTDLPKQMGIESAIAGILNAMKTHKTNAKVQGRACAALAKLARNDENRKRIAKKGGISAIVYAMKVHEKSERVQLGACEALNELANDAENQKQIASEGGVASIICAMETHENDALRMTASCSLEFLATDNPKNLKKIVEAGGIAALIRVMLTHKKRGRNPKAPPVPKGFRGIERYYGQVLERMNVAYDGEKGTLKISNGYLPRFDRLAKLKLKELDLSNNGIRYIPPSIGLLTSLTRLDLSNNRLTKVPKEICSLTGLVRGLLYKPSDGLFLSGNPIVEPSMESCAEGISGIAAYWDAKEADFGVVETCYDKKVLFVGTGGAGKTSLRMNLTDAHGKRTKEGHDRATIGIDVHKMMCDTATELSLWDFGGQEEYYQTHALFLTPRSIYVLVVDIAVYDRRSPEHFKVHVQQWVDKLRTEAERVAKENAVATQVSEITIVATKIDGVSDAKELDKRIQDLWNRLTNADRERRQRFGAPGGACASSSSSSSIRFPKTAEDILLVCSDDGRGVEALRAHLVARTREEPVYMPATWKKLLESMRRIGSEGGGALRRVSLKAVRAVALNVAEMHAKSLSKTSNASKALTFVPHALRLFHDLGWVLWYEKNESLKTSIFTRPVAVVDMLKSIVRHNMPFHVGQLIKKEILVESIAVPPGSTLRELKRGVLTRRLVKALWHEYKVHEHKDLHALTNLCCTLDLLVPFEGRCGIDGYFAPFYLEELPLRREDLLTLAVPLIELLPVSQSARCRIGRLYEFDLYFPSGLFCRMLVRWLKRLDGAFDWSAWRNGFRIKGGGALRAAIVWWQHPRNRKGCLAFHAVAEDTRRAWKTLTPLLNDLKDVLKTYRHVEYVASAMYWEAACKNDKISLPIVHSLATLHHALSRSEDNTLVTIAGKTFRVAHLFDDERPPPAVATYSPGRSVVSVPKALEAEDRADSGAKRPFLLAYKQDSKPVVHFVKCYFSTYGESLRIRSEKGGVVDERPLPLRGWRHEDMYNNNGTLVPELRLFRGDGGVGSFVFCARAASEDAEEEFTQFRSVLLKKLMYLGCMISLSYADFKSHTWRKIGSGRYGTTFAAVFYGKPVAIKAVPASRVIQTELDILKRVVGYGGHPHLVRYYGDFVQTTTCKDDENLLCIAMEKCDVDLETVLHVSNAFEWTPKEPRWKYRDMWSR